jgi:3-deoxy-D-manno-oct-2-ulosonic acid (Kdo) hydroxylase
MTTTESPILEIPPFAQANVPAETLKLDLTAALEVGKVVSIPGMNFALSEEELKLLDPRILAKAKNVSYSPSTGKIGGTSCTGREAEILTGMIARYSKLAGELIGALFPPYRGKFQLLRTSLRPAEIAGRKSSWRKDDTRLHVDAFPSQPTNGNRILRVFCNINPVGKPRVWRLGEPFEKVAQRFLPRIGRPFPGSARIQQMLHITKGLRSEYDFVMLKMHDEMKADDAYQASIGQTPVPFASGTIWVCYADSVSHAAISGQHQFEQTVRIPLAAMQDQSRSPLRILERMRQRPLA